MATPDGGGDSSPPPRESPAVNESFVKKVSSRVSGILPSISKWFSTTHEPNRSTIRYRDEDDDDDDDDDEDQSFRIIQPPSKKLKLPAATSTATDSSFIYNNFTLGSMSTMTPLPPLKRQEHFAEPVAGPSGVKSRKLHLGGDSRETSVLRKDLVVVNGDNNSDSGDSTSGYSSMARIGSKEQIGQGGGKGKTHLGEAGESLLFNNSTSPSRSEENTRSLFHERSFTSRSNSSLSSRRPSFSASNFGSPTFIDRTLSTQRVLNSPFYNGRTIYGGASAYGRKLGRSSSELRSNLNNSVEVKPKNGGSNESLMLSKTARRILDTLEQYTTPVNDAKKIPVVARRHVRQQEGLLSKFTGANPYARDVKAPSNTELHIPTVPELLKMKQQLQESTEAVREIATHSKSTLNKEEYKLPVVVEEAASRHTSKIKTKLCAVRQKPTNHEVTEAVKLPAVALPISTLPKFDFSVPPPTPKQDKTEPPKTNPISEYKFSKPIVIAENIDNIIGANNFKFREPIAINHLKKNFKTTDPSEFKPKRVQKNNGEIQPAAQLLSGSVMDVLFGKQSTTKATTNQLLEKFKPKEGTWECQSCLVRNEADKTKCVACETAKVAPSAAPTTNQLLEKFKPKEGTWECQSCLVRNQPDKTKCVACETAKVAPSTATNPLLEKFKPAEGTWECPICMIRNKPDLTRCAACESPRTAPPPKPQQQQPQTTSSLFKITPDNPQWQCTKCKANNKNDTNTCSGCKTARFTFGFGEQFKPPKETWECSSCMVRNQKSAEKCVACESPNPETAKKVNSGFGGQFTKKSSEWECPSCMVKNSSDKTKCVCCETAKPGSDGLDDKKCGLTKFSFGVDKQATSKFTFGIQPTTTTTTNNFALPQQQQNSSSSFVFGDTTKKPAVSVAQPTFSFGLPAKATTTTQAESKPEKTPEKTDTTAPPKPIAAPSSLPSIPSNLFSTITTTKSESTTTIKPLFQFSTTTTTTATKPTNTTFGTTTPPKTFSFGGSTTATTSKNESSDDAAPPAKMPTFSFGGKNALDKPKETASSGSSGGFSFGGENKAPTFQFNAPTTTTVAPPTQNGFSFGGSAAAAATNSSSQTSGFSFGKVAAAPPTGIFSFGSNSNTQQPTAGPSGGFNFSATAPPAFNPDVQPTFNFTSGSSISFSAQASTNGTALPQRRIKRALRRANR